MIGNNIDKKLNEVQLELDGYGETTAAIQVIEIRRDFNELQAEISEYIDTMYKKFISDLEEQYNSYIESNENAAFGISKALDALENMVIE